LINNDVLFLDFKWPWASEEEETGGGKGDKDQTGAKKK